MSVPYLYDGDAISSTDESYSEVKTTPLTSPTFIITTIIKIYNESINSMISKSKEILITEESISMNIGNTHSIFGGNILDKLTEMGINPLYIFTSKIGFSKLFGISRNPDSNKPFPGYFYNLDKFVGLHLEVFYSPLINDDDGYTLYVSDKSFQSLVYSIQNMDYRIYSQNVINGNRPYNETEWLHTLDYKLYDCDYNSYKIVIKNVSKIREDKINQILNGD